MLPQLEKELAFLVLQYLDEGKFEEALHKWATSTSPLSFSLFSYIFGNFYISGLARFVWLLTTLGAGGILIRERNLSYACANAGSMSCCQTWALTSGSTINSLAFSWTFCFSFSFKTFNWLLVWDEGWGKSQGYSLAWGISRIVCLVVNGTRSTITYLGLLRLELILTRWRFSMRFESKNSLRHLTSKFFFFFFFVSPSSLAIHSSRSSWNIRDKIIYLFIFNYNKCAGRTMAKPLRFSGMILKFLPNTTKIFLRKWQWFWPWITLGMFNYWGHLIFYYLILVMFPLWFETKMGILLLFCELKLFENTWDRSENGELL